MIALLEREGVDRAHFLSMSLGGLVAEAIGLLYPERMSSMILAGGIAKLDWWATLLMYLGRATSLLMPYMALYRIFAWIIMPGARHARTRLLFYAHAQRLGREEFLRWYRLSSEVKTLLSRSANRPAPIPSLFVMGADDYMFLPQAVERARSRTDTTVATIGNCGHVCSVERPDEFNRVVEEFLQALKSR
jgi:pimeloyl-ACP methyl ester carboxylesterase